MDEKELQQDELEIDLWVLLRDFIVGCTKFWWLVVLLAVLGAASMLLKDTGFYTPMYRSQATFTVTTNTSDNGSGYNFYYDSSTAQQLSLTFPYILSSDLLTDAIMQDMGTTSINGSISATSISDSNMITMCVISSDPEDAQAI